MYVTSEIISPFDHVLISELTNYAKNREFFYLLGGSNAIRVEKSTHRKVYLVNFGLRLQFSEIAEKIAVRILLAVRNCVL